MKKLIWLIVGLVVIVPVLFWLGLKLPVFGAHPSDTDKEGFQRSSAFNEQLGIFENRRNELFDAMREDSSMLEMLKEWFTVRPDGVPAQPLPEQQPDIDAFLSASSNTKLIWFGHSTFLVNIAGTIVLIDPVFSPTAAPVSFTAKRFQAPVLPLQQLPDVDVVLISHDHYDHLDMQTIEFFKDKNSEFILPLGVGVHLQRWGIDKSRITERDWWESYTTNGIEFTATPAQHFSGRDGINNNETLWASWSVISDQSRLFYSGDSGYDTHFVEIGNRLGPFDIAFMENGQYNEAWAAVHMMPDETLQAYKDVKAKHLIPIHWGMFELAFHTWYDPVVQLSAFAQAEDIDVITPMIGQVLEVDTAMDTTQWWQPE